MAFHLRNHVMRNLRIFSSRNSAEECLEAADQARDQQQWHVAAHHYAHFLKRHSHRQDIWVQLGNVRKECGDLEESQAAYQKALKVGPEGSDIFLQFGHLKKRMGDLAGSRECYLKALQFAPPNLNAYEELERMGYREQADNVIQQINAGISETDETLCFDVSDLVFYIGHHDNLSGIQRVQVCIISAILKSIITDKPNINFISYDRKAFGFRTINREFFQALLDQLCLPADQRSLKFDVEAARQGRLFPEAPIASILTPARTTIILLGAAWVIPDYPSAIANLKRRYSVNFVMLFHDFIPIYARETCDQGTAEVFQEFVSQILPLTDVALCVSKSTERDLKRYCSDQGIHPPRTQVTRLGSKFDEFFPLNGEEKSELKNKAFDENYVLFVSTIEGRKNHDYIFQVWQSLSKREIRLPKLICVGRLGWRAETFLSRLIETDYLDGKIEIREDVGDLQLADLYRGALLTVFPSLYEGWGLPIGESLSHGKVCILAKNSSLPEVAGKLGLYIPLDDPVAAADIVSNVLSDPTALAKRERAIAEHFKLISWTTVAEVVLDACKRESGPPQKSGRSLLELGKEYTTRELRQRFTGLMGNDMFMALSNSYQGPILKRSVNTDRKTVGLLARDINWHGPEDWGSWARSEKAGLQFSLDAKQFEDETAIIFYAALSFIDKLLPAKISLHVPGTLFKDTKAVEDADAVLAWEIPVGELLKLRPYAADQDLIDIDLSLSLSELTEQSLDELRKIDPRLLMFGIKSFLFVKASDLATRVKIAEQQLFRVSI